MKIYGAQQKRRFPHRNLAKASENRPLIPYCAKPGIDPLKPASGKSRCYFGRIKEPPVDKGVFKMGIMLGAVRRNAKRLLPMLKSTQGQTPWRPNAKPTARLDRLPESKLTAGIVVDVRDRGKGRDGGNVTCADARDLSRERGTVPDAPDWDRGYIPRACARAGSS